MISKKTIELIHAYVERHGFNENRIEVSFDLTLAGTLQENLINESPYIIFYFESKEDLINKLKL